MMRRKGSRPANRKRSVVLLAPQDLGRATSLTPTAQSGEKPTHNYAKRPKPQPPPAVDSPPKRSRPPRRTRSKHQRRFRRAWLDLRPAAKGASVESRGGRRSKRAAGDCRCDTHEG